MDEWSTAAVHERRRTSPPGIDRVGTSYATDRWAQAVLAGATATIDPNTLGKWATFAARSVSSLTTCCRAANVSPRRSLDLTRLLRGVSMTGGAIRELLEVLDVVDPRTLSRLLARAGLRADPGPGLRPEAFLLQQRLVTDRRAVDALIRRLRSSLGEPHSARPGVSSNDGPAVVMNVIRFQADGSAAAAGEALIETRLSPAGLVIYCFVNGEFTWSRACNDGRQLYVELARVRLDFAGRGWREGTDEDCRRRSDDSGA